MAKRKVFPIVFAMFIFVGFNCREKGHSGQSNLSSGSNAQPGPIASAPASIADVVVAWRESAAARKLPKGYSEIVAQELCDILSFAKSHPTASQVAACKVSFDRILQSHDRLYDDRYVQGCARWIAWCAAEAFERGEASADAKLRVANDYDQFVQELTARMRTRLLEKIPADRRVAYGPEMDRWFAVWRNNLERWMTGLQEDFLFPAFREPLPTAGKDFILSEYDKPTMYPDWEASPPNPMNTADDWYQPLLKAWFRNSLGSVMFMATINEVKPRFNFNKYWGHCLHSSTGTATLWPLQVGIEPDKNRNAERGWIRKTHE